MSIFGVKYWKEIQKSPDTAFNLMQQDDCWFFDEKPTGYKWGEISGPFKLFVPSLGRTVKIYAKTDEIVDSQNRILGKL